MLFRKLSCHIKTHYCNNIFIAHKFIFIIQCLCATGVLFFTLITLDVFTNAAIVASIGATSFIVFTKPHDPKSMSRYVIGGYIVGISIGWLAEIAMNWSLAHEVFWFTGYYHEVFGALAVGITMLITVILNIEHPPAAGLALGMVLRRADSQHIIIVVALSLVLLLIFRRLLRRWLIDLVC